MLDQYAVSRCVFRVFSIDSGGLNALTLYSNSLDSTNEYSFDGVTRVSTKNLFEDTMLYFLNLTSLSVSIRVNLQDFDPSNLY